MVKKIIKDVLIFKKATPATEEDLFIAQDLIDTLRANSEICVGMAANMIGYNKRIIAVAAGPMIIPMLNPQIVKKSKESFEPFEGCLSLYGVKKTLRYKSIEVEFYDLGFKKHHHKYSGYIAQIIQHEIDHCDGKII